MSKGYVVVNLDVHDAQLFEKYRAEAPKSIAQYGGKYIVRGGAMEVLEGAAPHPRIVMLEFPSVEQAKTWYNSPEYQGVIGMRHQASTGSGFVVEGFGD
jgi:uncharacterized protein (DUF1330 family)